MSEGCLNRSFFSAARGDGKSDCVLIVERRREKKAGHERERERERGKREGKEQRSRRQESRRISPVDGGCVLKSDNASAHALRLPLLLLCSDSDWRAECVSAAGSRARSCASSLVRVATAAATATAAVAVVVGVYRSSRAAPRGEFFFSLAPLSHCLRKHLPVTTRAEPTTRCTNGQVWQVTRSRCSVRRASRRRRRRSRCRQPKLPLHPAALRALVRRCLRCLTVPRRAPLPACVCRRRRRRRPQSVFSAADGLRDGPSAAIRRRHRRMLRPGAGKEWELVRERTELVSLSKCSGV